MSLWMSQGSHIPMCGLADQILFLLKQQWSVHVNRKSEQYVQMKYFWNILQSYHILSQYSQNPNNWKQICQQGLWGTFFRAGGTQWPPTHVCDPASKVHHRCFSEPRPWTLAWITTHLRLLFIRTGFQRRPLTPLCRWCVSSPHAYWSCSDACTSDLFIYGGSIHHFNPELFNLSTLSPPTTDL